MTLQEILSANREPTRWAIQDRETGTVIDYFDSYEDARAELDRYESEDMANGVYTPDFYEIREI